MKKIRILPLILLLALLFTACGAAVNESSSAAADSYYRAEVPQAAIGAVTDTESGSVNKVSFPVDQKLIRTIWLETETEDMTSMLSTVEEKVAQLEGYIEDRSLQNGSMYATYRSRSGSLTIRIPAQNLDEFISHMSGISNIVSNRETTEDVTLSYVENESQVLALETEQTRLLELLAKAESMDDILLIEGRLTQIRGELEKVKSTLRVYDNLVNYGTIHLQINEVVEYTDTEPEPTSLWKRMGRGLSSGWKDMTRGFGNFLVFLVTVLPSLIPIAAIVVLIVFAIKHRKKKKAEKRTPAQQETTEE